ncbi:hypothetical protein FOXYSP1_05967 [Fusarium oxysporum f. sp. phaseoli]
MIRVGYSPQITPAPGARAVTRETSLDMKRLHKWPSRREDRMSNISKTVPREQSQVCPRPGYGFRNTPPSRYTRDATAGTRVALGSPGACLSHASSPTHLRTKSLDHAGKGGTSYPCRCMLTGPADSVKGPKKLIQREKLNHHFDESTSHSSRSSQVASAAMEGWNVGDYNLVADVESRTATTLDD